MPFFEPPRIEKIDDILPFIEERDEIVAIEKEFNGVPYKAIDYLVVLEDTFDESIPERRECRGILFGPDGEIIGRRFHKFFNVGERPSTHPLIVEKFIPGAVFQQKMDGSMVSPVFLGNGWFLATRKGRTDVSIKAEKYFDENLVSFSKALYEQGMNPIFEFVDPDCPIVIRYDKPDFILLAIRRIVDGSYVEYGKVREWAKDYNIRVVECVDPLDDLDGFIQSIQDLENIEGFVIWNGNNAFKIKIPWYVLRHSIKESVLHLKNRFSLVLDNGVDDVLPLLDDRSKNDLLKFQNKIVKLISENVDKMGKFVVEARSSSETQKDFALKVKASGFHPMFHGCLYKSNDINDVRDALMKLSRKQVGSSEKTRSFILLLEENVKS